MARFKDTYRIESTRLKEWDYSNPWWYYVTINTKNHIEYFGKIINGKMILNDLGKIVEQNWIEIPLHFPNTEIDYYVIMPNHVHGIIIINPDVETCHGKSLQEKERKFSKPIKNSLSVIINQLKGSVKRWANQNGFESFSWQSRFYDRIIRNEKELYKIRIYINKNPMKWEFDKNTIYNIYD